jgi:hypothetical protein
VLPASCTHSPPNLRHIAKCNKPHQHQCTDFITINSFPWKKVHLIVEISGDWSMSHAYPIVYRVKATLWQSQKLVAPVLQATGATSESVQPLRTTRCGTEDTQSRPSSCYVNEVQSGGTRWESRLMRVNRPVWPLVSEKGRKIKLLPLPLGFENVRLKSCRTWCLVTFSTFKRRVSFVWTTFHELAEANHI